MRLADCCLHNDRLSVEEELVLSNGEVAHAEDELGGVNRFSVSKQAHLQAIEKWMVGRPKFGIRNRQRDINVLAARRQQNVLAQVRLFDSGIIPLGGGKGEGSFRVQPGEICETACDVDFARIDVGADETVLYPCLVGYLQPYILPNAAEVVIPNLLGSWDFCQNHAVDSFAGYPFQPGHKIQRSHR